MTFHVELSRPFFSSSEQFLGTLKLKVNPPPLFKNKINSQFPTSFCGFSTRNNHKARINYPAISLDPSPPQVPVEYSRRPTSIRITTTISTNTHSMSPSSADRWCPALVWSSFCPWFPVIAAAVAACRAVTNLSPLAHTLNRGRG